MAVPLVQRVEQQGERLKANEQLRNQLVGPTAVGHLQGGWEGLSMMVTGCFGGMHEGVGRGEVT